MKRSSSADRAPAIALAVLLIVAFAFGGGGSRFGLANLVVQLAALAALAANREASLRFWRDSPISLRLLIALSLLLPLAQMIPLPPAAWTGLPGRDLVAASLDAAEEGGYMTLSVDPRRTLLALAALVTPLAVLMIGWAIPRDHLLTIGWLVAGLGAVTTLFGVVQLNPAGDNLTFYDVREPGAYLSGTFANRNSTANFLIFALALVCLLPAPRPGPAVLPLRLGCGALILVTIVLTQSRTGLVLAAIPLGLAAMRTLQWMRERRAVSAGQARRQPWIIIPFVTLALAVTALGSLAIIAPDRIGATMERFEARNDPRRFIWEDAIYSADRYWPVGAGMGSFDEVFQVDESLENLTRRTAGRAHNDYLELAIEAGIAGLAIAAAWIILCFMFAWRAQRSPMAWAGWAGGASLLAIALQSITDYPLRNQSILAFAAFALLLLARCAAHEGKRA